MNKILRDPKIPLDLFLKVTLLTFISKTNRATVIVTNNLTESRIVKEKLISLHSELPDWLGMDIVKSVLRETRFLNNNAVFITHNAKYAKSISFQSLAWIDTSLSVAIPSDVLSFGKRVTRLFL